MMKKDVRVRVHEEIRVEMYKEGKNDGERARERKTSGWLYAWRRK